MLIKLFWNNQKLAPNLAKFYDHFHKEVTGKFATQQNNFGDKTDPSTPTP